MIESFLRQLGLSELSAYVEDKNKFLTVSLLGVKDSVIKSIISRLDVLQRNETIVGYKLLKNGALIATDRLSRMRHILSCAGHGLHHWALGVLDAYLGFEKREYPDSSDAKKYNEGYNADA